MYKICIPLLLLLLIAATMPYGKGGRQNLKGSKRDAARIPKAERSALRQAEAAERDSKKPVVPAEEEEDAKSPAKPPRLTMADREAAGFQVCNQTELRMYCVVAYRVRFGEPDESDWGGYAGVLSDEIGMNKESIKAVFRRCRDGDIGPAAQKEGAGRPRKLAPDNPGLSVRVTLIKDPLPGACGV